MNLAEIRNDIQLFADKGVDPEVVKICYHNHMVYELSRRLSRAKIDKLHDAVLEELLELLDRVEESKNA
jgi:hypothetical protein